MKQQTDDPNARMITVNPGVEVDTYFGCWLDVNEASQSFLIPTPPANQSQWDGPWPGTESINGVISTAPHQCLIAEIRFDDTPVPAGATTANSDKLAQRNIAWLHGPNPGVAPSRRTPHPVEIRPTPTANTLADEIMISWGSTPAGSLASLYLPAVTAAEIVALADRMYPSHRLRAVDTHTLEFPSGGATYLPVPKGIANNAGLLTIDLPEGIRQHEVYDIVVRQFTEAIAIRVPDQPGRPPDNRISTPALSRTLGDVSKWRRVLGAFQFKITIGIKERLLYPEEQLLAWLKWRLQVTPTAHRWRPVLQRYLELVSGRVLGFGGNPDQIEPSPEGRVPKHRRHEPPEAETHHTGKVSGLIYDRFGDFEGFLLRTEEGRELRFNGREQAIEDLIYRAWTERMVIRVVTDNDNPYWPERVVLLRNIRRGL